MPEGATEEKGGLSRPDVIRVRGARTHNLKDIDLDLPRDRLIVITGPSGSGKSSLAFDTLFAEGQRRYVESLSAGARQFLAQLPKPDADLIEGLSPAIAISQGGGGRNPRSTVGTVTELLDHLRLLYARTGEVYSHVSGQPMRRHTVEDMLEALLALPAGTRLSILAPIVRKTPGDHAERLDALRRQGFVRVAIDGEVFDLSETVRLDPKRRHDLDVYVDRLKLKDGIRGRLADSLEVALRLADGRCHVLTVDGQELQFCERYTDFENDLAYPELTPALFSFNSPEGACPECDGLGQRRAFDPRKLVPDPSRSVADGALAPWARGLGAGRGKQALARQLAALAEHLGFDLYAPFSRLPAAAQVALLQGTGDEAIALGKKRAPFEGLVPQLTRLLREAEERAGDDDEGGRGLEALEEYMTTAPCPACAGQRLRLEARMVRLGEKNLSELSAMALDRLLPFLNGLTLDREREEIAAVILERVRQRLGFMIDLGLGYLTLDRPTMTLSGGEAQRIRLATQIGVALVGVTYILDEPSIGLHQRDNHRLLAALERLRTVGNTVIVVEHDEDTIRAADYLVDMGPGAGVFGGEVVAAGPRARVLADEASLTAAYLRGDRRIARPIALRPESGLSLTVEGARGHNLQGVTARFPLAALTCVTGVSGSGKSTLVIDTLLAVARRRLMGAAVEPLAHDRVLGLEHLDKVIIDQSPIGRSPRSNPRPTRASSAGCGRSTPSSPDARVRATRPRASPSTSRAGAARRARARACGGSPCTSSPTSTSPAAPARAAATTARPWRSPTGARASPTRSSCRSPTPARSSRPTPRSAPSSRRCATSASAT
ncbi:MAG: excinuclease ABC subunit UvrA [Nannocystaceae bacterium]